MSFLKTYIHYIMQPAKLMSESGPFGSSLSDLHPPTQDDALAVRNPPNQDDAPAVRKSESEKHSFLSFNESGPAGQFNESPILSSEKSPAVVPLETEPSSSEIRFLNDSLPGEESGAASWVASRQLGPGTDDLKPLTQTGSPGADQKVRQRPAEIFKTNIVADIPRTDNPGREEKTGPVGNPELRNDSALASQPAPETFETGEFGDPGRNPDPVPETVQPMKLTNKDSGKNPEGKIPQKKTGAIEQQNRVNEGTVRVEASDDRLEKIFPHRAEPVQNRQSKTVPPAREIPQVRIGHINVLVEDRSKANARPGQGRAAAAPPSPNPFGLKGV